MLYCNDIYKNIFSFLEYDSAKQLIYVSKYFYELIDDFLKYFHIGPWVRDITPRVLNGQLPEDVSEIYKIWNDINHLISPCLVDGIGKIGTFNNLTASNANIIPIEVYMLEWMVMNFTSNKDRIAVIWDDREVGHYNLYRLKSTVGITWIFRDMTYIYVLVDELYGDEIGIYSGIPICKTVLDYDRNLELIYDIVSGSYYFETVDSNRSSDRRQEYFRNTGIEARRYKCNRDFMSALDVIVNNDLTYLELPSR